MTSMKKFDIAYKFTVVGIKTVEDFSANEAINEFQQDLVDTIQIDLGDGAMLLDLQGGVHTHNPTQVEFEIADILERKACGMFSASAGIVPYSTKVEDEDTPESDALIVSQ